MTRPYLSDIPGARRALEQIAKWAEAGRDGVEIAAYIRNIIDTKLHRHKADRRAPKKAVTTKAKKQQAVELRRLYPTASQIEIGANVGLNQGRVSEAIHSQKKKPSPGGTLLLLALGFVGGLLLASSEGRASDASLAFCGLYAREAVRIDIMHVAPVSASVTDAYIEGMAVQVFKQCISVLPALLPLPEGHRDLDSWVKDMQRMLISRSGIEPAGDAPERAQGDEDDEAWREACRAEYRTWSEEDGTVIRNGNPERVRCPLQLIDGAWRIPE